MKIQDHLVNMMTEIEKLALAGAKPIRGIATPFHNVNRSLQGLEKGEVVTVASRPGMGLTSLFLTMALDMTQQGLKVLFISRDRPELLSIAATSSLAQIPKDRLRLARIQEREWPKLAAAADKLSRCEFYTSNSCANYPEQVPDVVFIDGVTSFQSFKARYFSSVLFLGVPLAESIDCRANKRPWIGDIENHHAYGSDHVFFLYRDEYYHRQTEDKGIAELILAKSKRSERETFRLAFLPEYGLFANLEREPLGA